MNLCVYNFLILHLTNAQPHLDQPHAILDHLHISILDMFCYPCKWGKWKTHIESAQKNVPTIVHGVFILFFRYY